MRVTRLIGTFFALAMLIVCVPIQASSSAPPASATIEKFHIELLDIMKNAESLGYEGRKTRMSEIIPSVIDISFMSEKSLGRSWKKLSPEQQVRMRTAMHDLALSRYAHRFNNYSGEEFTVLNEEIDEKGNALVRCQIKKSDGELISINYRMHQVEGQWLIIDVLLNGSVSELAMRRSEFSALLKREGFETLLAAVNSRIKTIEEKAENAAS